MNRDSRYNDRGRYQADDGYRPNFNNDRSPRRDGFRGTRSPPRASQNDRYSGPPPMRSNRRSRSPVSRNRDTSPRAGEPNQWRGRERSPIRRWSPRRDGPRRDERPRSRSPQYQSRGPRQRSPPPSSRARDPSPQYRGRRSPPPARRERFGSPPPRGRYDRPRSPRTERPISPSPRQTQRMRSPRSDNRGTPDNRRWGARSPSPRGRNQRYDEYNENLSGRNSNATSRRSSPPIHPSRVANQSGYEQSNRSPADPSMMTGIRRGRSPPRGPMGSRPESPQIGTPVRAGDRRVKSPPTYPRTSERPSFENNERPYPIRDRSPPRRPNEPFHRESPNDRESNNYSASTERGSDNAGFQDTPFRGPPTGPSRNFEHSAANPPSGPANPQGSIHPHNRPGNIPVPSAPRELRGGGRGMIPRRESHHNGPPPEFRRGGPPSYGRGPRPSFGPPMYRTNNSSSTTYPRTQRFNNYLSDLPKILPGGKLNPAYEVSDKLKKLESDKRKLEEALVERETKKRAALREWDRLERDSIRETLKTELAEEQIRKISGEGGYGGSAF